MNKNKVTERTGLLNISTVIAVYNDVQLNGASQGTMP